MFLFPSFHGILGMNARNLLYIKPFNPRKAVAFADDKLKTKAFLAARGIPVAKIYARIESRRQLKDFDFSQLPEECVLKPNNGYGGQGILILRGRRRGMFLVAGKEPISEKEMREHIEDILDGRFSVNGRPDTAFFEKILVPDSAFAHFRPLGLPDIRIVVFNLVPVMAMLRIPTAQSGGKANVHLGGIGIGIDIAKGVTTFATQYNKRLYQLPNGQSPSGFQIPRWENLLLIASRIQSITNIGYIAVDLTIDADQGPVLLEVNARAGLMVQVANLAPLRSRLERVKGLPVTTPEKGVRIAQEIFGVRAQEKRDRSFSDKPILSTREVISVTGGRVTMDVPCLIAPDQEWTTFTSDLLDELLASGSAALEEEEALERTYRVKFTLGGKRIQTLVHDGEISMPSVRAMIGRRDLAGFLIDPGKEPGNPLVRVAAREDERALDKLLAQADRDLLLLKYLKPQNLAEERARLEQDMSYNPTFQYQPIDLDLAALEERLLSLRTDQSPLGLLFEKKRRELLVRLTMLRSIGDTIRFSEASQTLYGFPRADMLSDAQEFLRAQVACELPPPDLELLSAEQVVPIFEDVLAYYGLHTWQIHIRESVVADCTVGGQRVYIRTGARFSRTHVDALIAHEIETHALTQENAEHQPYLIFRRGFANYLDTQEGLAIFMQNRALPPFHEKRFRPAQRVLATAFALQHSFADTRRYLMEELGVAPERALTQSIDLKRGIADTAEPGAFTRGLVYFRGLRAIEHLDVFGSDLKRLFVGKVALEDIDIIEQIPGVREPLVLPKILSRNS